MRLLQELKRRRVVRVLLVYLASGFAVMEAADILTSALSLPGWMLQVAIAVLAGGLPVALVLSWVYDLTPKGVEHAEVLGGSDTAPRPVRGQSSWLSPSSVVLASTLVAAGAGATRLFDSMLTRAGGGDVASNSIAVLPFDGDGAADRSFGDGLHEDLLTRLTRLSALKVIARASVLEYRERDKPIDEIARELGVATLLLGTVRHAGDRVRVSVELVDPLTRVSRWADSYDRTLENIFDIQSDIATSISEALEASLTPREVRALNGRPTESFEAYELFVRGEEILTRTAQTLDPSELEVAMESFESAVEIDPGFALAHAYASVAYEWGQRGSDDDTKAELGQRALRSARTALRLKPELPEANIAMAFQNAARPGDRARTEEDVRLLRVALEGLPNDPFVMRELALRLERLGRVDEAASYSYAAAEREPRSALYQGQAANHALLLRDFARAERHMDMAASISARAPRVSDVLYRMRILLALADDGGVDGAKEVFRRELQESDLGSQAIVARLETFPELLEGGDYDDLVSSLSPDADDEALRCACYEVKAWMHTVAGRAERARPYWDSLAVETLGVGEWSDANAAALGMADRAMIFARAGRMEDARQELAAMEALGADVLERPAQLIGRENWRDVRYVRAEAYSALGDVGAATGILARMLAEPTGVTAEYLQARIAWDAIRDDPAFAALLNR